MAPYSAELVASWWTLQACCEMRLRLCSQLEAPPAVAVLPLMMVALSQGTRRWGLQRTILILHGPFVQYTVEHAVSSTTFTALSFPSDMRR